MELYDSKVSLPNKLLQEDGTITDITGAPVTNAVEAYNAKPALPNKFLNPDGSYSTLNEIISSIVDTDLFVIVNELPQEGSTSKIYLVPNGNRFDEYIWTGSGWDNIGMMEFDISQYSTTEQMNQAIATALQTAKTYADGKANTAETNAKTYADTKKSEAITSANNYTNDAIQTSITQVLGGSY